MKLSLPFVALAISVAQLGAALPVPDGSIGSTELQLSMRSPAAVLDLTSEGADQANLVLPQTAPSERSVIFARSDRDSDGDGVQHGNKARGWFCFSCLKKPAVGGSPRTRPQPQPQHAGTPPGFVTGSGVSVLAFPLPPARQPQYVSPTQSQRNIRYGGPLGADGKVAGEPGRPAPDDVGAAGTSLGARSPPAPAKVQSGDPSSLDLPPTAPSKRSSPGDRDGEHHGSKKARAWPCLTCFKKPAVGSPRTMPRGGSPAPSGGYHSPPSGSSPRREYVSPTESQRWELLETPPRAEGKAPWKPSESQPLSSASLSPVDTRVSGLSAAPSMFEVGQSAKSPSPPRTAPSKRSSPAADSVIFGRSDREGEQHGNGNKARGWFCLTCIKKPVVSLPHAKPAHQRAGTSKPKTPRPDSSASPAPGYLSATQAQRVEPYNGLDGQMRVPSKQAFSFTDNNPGYRPPPKDA